uniref:Uncharacterized protein n=1 Tax=Romanomermis culicivorax TaxID=13658 RepID=A0A915HZ92_ROMCU
MICRRYAPLLTIFDKNIESMRLNFLQSFFTIGHLWLQKRSVTYGCRRIRRK